MLQATKGFVIQTLSEATTYANRNANRAVTYFKLQWLNSLKNSKKDNHFR